MNGAQPRPFGAENDEEVVVLLVFVCGFLLVALAVGICFLLTLHKCLNRCAPRNRTMEPGQVWLNLIPCFNIVWQFVTVVRMRDTLQNEFDDRRLRAADPSFGFGFGMAAICLNMLGNVVSKVGDATGNFAIDLASFGIALIGLGLGITYWVKIAGYSRQLADDGEYVRRRRSRDDDAGEDRPRRLADRGEDDDYEDRPRRRRYREDEDEDGYDDRPRRRRPRDDDDDR